MPKSAVTELAFPCEASFHDNIIIKINHEKEQGEDLSSVLLREGLRKCNLFIQGSEIKFFHKDNDKTPFATYRFLGARN